MKNWGSILLDFLKLKIQRDESGFTYVLWIFIKAGFDEIFEIFRVIPAELRRIIFWDEKEHPHRVKFGVGGFPFRQLDGGYTETPDVRFGIVRGLFDDFWRHPERGADERVPLARRVRQLSRHTEIGQLDVAHLAQKDVRRFYVAMEFPLAVEIVETFEHLAQYYRDVHLLEVARFHQIERRAPAQVFHDNP